MVSDTLMNGIAGYALRSVFFKIFTDMCRLFNSKRFSDVAVHYEGRTWYAHKNILCTQSEYFTKACEGEFKVDVPLVSSSIPPEPIQEAKDGLIDLNDDGPDVVDAMLKHFYTGGYTDVLHGDDAACPAAVFNVRVFAIAEKYCLEPLLKSSAGKFSTAIQQDWNTDGFAEAIHETCNSTATTTCFFETAL